jgi:NAD(P)-dependent dehydrogenase (short-subunit alcohol dehydrogenase family)
MLEAGKGSIITVASVAAKNPDAGPLAYTVSKAGVWMLTKKVFKLLQQNVLKQLKKQNAKS